MLRVLNMQDPHTVPLSGTVLAMLPSMMETIAKVYMKTRLSTVDAISIPWYTFYTHGFGDQ